ncbi:ABC transporter substrate-binding protein [Paenibacillus sp. SC116]|uniref:ABC transporter substrate-binding protein n=1 Tax=Paenibacillus sp. SC116 TaxID=2968986 RepID=UPI00215A4EAF|nr:ABC transporter substrate-binding protein [Paenibacillus sp. SC116]MCR8845954.1 ABC transporter substrate-binding protein [Paenibacillus sp. SC116]
MKKKLLILLSAVMAFSLILSACGGGDAAKPADPGTKVETPAEGEKPAEGELVTEGLIKATDPSKAPATAAARKDTVILGVPAPSGVFHPAFQESSYDVWVNDLLFTTLLEIQKDGSYAPHLGDYKVSDDNKTITFTLKDAKFSDGKPVTADDVVFTLTLLYDKSYDGPSDAFAYAPVVGAKDYKEGKAQSISGLKAVDPKTVEITLETPSVLSLDVFGGTGILPKHVYESAYKPGDLSKMKDTFLNPVGSGPYTLEKFVPKQEVVFKANPNYFLGAPKVPNLIYKATTEETNMQLVQTGETDGDTFISATLDNVQAIQEFGFADLMLNPTNGYGFIGLNHKDEKFSDKRVRQALVYGLNRQDVVDGVYQGLADVINIPQSKVSWAYTDEVNKYEYDIEKAKALLDEAGWKVGADGIREKDGKKFTITFTASTPNTVNEVLIPIAKENYAQLGIEFIPDQMDFNALLDKVEKGNFEMVFLASALTPNPQIAQGTFRTGGNQNKYFFSNARVDELFKQANSEFDLEKRKAYYKEIYQITNEEVAQIFLYQRRDTLTTNSRIQGFDTSPYKDFTADAAAIQIQ